MVMARPGDREETAIAGVFNPQELQRRLVRRSDFVSARQSFVDCRMPGADLKENYSIIGPGVSQTSAQVVNLVEPHGFNIGAAAMPHGVTNNLHMHFTAEVFLNFFGDWRIRWGRDGGDGELLSHRGDIISVPTWIFRGFTNEGPDDGWLFTVLGRDDTGGIVWDPEIIRSAADDGLLLTSENVLVDVVAGESLPAGAVLMDPMSEQDINEMSHVDVTTMAERVVTEDSLEWARSPYLCSGLPGGNVRLSPVIGYATVEDKTLNPRISNPHGFGVAWLDADHHEGVLRHRHSESEVLIGYQGRWRVTLNTGDDELVTDLEPYDVLSVPPGTWRSLHALSDEPARLVRVTGGDGRVRMEWSPEVRSAARSAGIVLDADGYRAPLSVVRLSTLDD